MITEEEVLTAVRGWFDEKPHDGRIISRGNIEGLLKLSYRIEPEELPRARVVLTRTCNKHFELRSPNRKTRTWVITGEALA
jgi:hypothetical protein